MVVLRFRAPFHSVWVSSPRPVRVVGGLTRASGG